jgi:WD40 repeat protein
VRLPPRLGPAGRLAYSPVGRTLTVAGRNGVLLCDLAGDRPRRPLPGYARSLAFTPDGGRLLTTTPDGGVAVWDVDAGTPRERYTFADLGFVWELAVAQDGLTAYAAGTGGRLVRWDL